MTSTRKETPTESDAAEIAQKHIGSVPAKVRRFATGLGHWVYDISGPDGLQLVVRMGTAKQREDFDGSIHWSRTLRPLGVPLPALLGHGNHRDLPYLVLERLKGEDLGHLYAGLKSSERKTIAEEVRSIQKLVGTLPPGNGYGFVRLPGDPCLKSWGDVVIGSLDRSRERISAAGLVSARTVDRVQDCATRLAAYFSRVRPTPFLDDVTTKNVLVHEGRLSGIVDVDWLCYGDPLFTVGLTRTALLSSGADTEYTDHWCTLLALTPEQKRAISFYTALFCVDFMSEFGQRFSQGVQPLDPERMARLEIILDEHLERAE